MPQLTRHARKHLDHINEALELIQNARTIGHRHAVKNPHFAMDKFEQIGTAVDTIRDHLRSLEPLLERQAPMYEQRLEELAQRVEALEAERKIIPLRKAE